MPIFVKHDSQVGALADLAANAGVDRTARQNLQDNLAVASFEDHQAQQAEAQRRADRAQQMGALQMILADQRTRDLTDQRNAAQYGLTDLRGQYGLAGIDARNAGTIANTQTREAGLENRNAADNATRIQIASQTDATRQRGQDLVNGLGYDRLQQGYDRMDATRELAEQRQRERVALEVARTAEQAARRQGEAMRSAQLAQLHAAIAEKQRQRSILEARARNGDSQAAQYITHLNADIKAMVDSIVPPPAPMALPAQPTAPEALPAIPPSGFPSGLGEAAQPVAAPAGPVSMGGATPPVIDHPTFGRLRLAGHAPDGEPMYLPLA